MEEELELSVIFGIIRKRIGLIISMTVGAAVIAVLLTVFVMKPKYASSVQLLVNQSSEQSQQINLNEVQTNVQLINTYKDLIKGDYILDDVKQKSEGNYTSQQLVKMINVTSSQNSQTFNIVVTAGDAIVAANLANTIAEVFINRIGEFYTVKNVNVVSEAKPNPNRVSPSLSRNVIFAIVIGLVVGIGYALLTEFLDTSVKEDKIFETLGWTNLGSIPEMKESELKETRLKRAQLSVPIPGKKRV